MTKRQVEICLARFVRGLPKDKAVPRHVYEIWEWMENGQQDKPPKSTTYKKAKVIPIETTIPEYVQRVKDRFLKVNN